MSKEINEAISKALETPANLGEAMPIQNLLDKEDFTKALSEEASAIVNTQTDLVREDLENLGEPCTVYLGVQISGDLSAAHMVAFATIINDVVASGLVEQGAAMPPMYMPIPARGTGMLLWYPMSRYSLAQLNNKVGEELFVFEGSIPAKKIQ